MGSIFVVVTGNIVSGFELWGPFPSLVEADRWGQQHQASSGERYTLARVDQPRDALKTDIIP